MRAKICVTLKPGLLDVQGKTIKGALESLGFSGVENVRMGKYIEVDLQGAAASDARKQVEAMCHKLLTNPIIETYTVQLDHGADTPAGGRSRG